MSFAIVAMGAVAVGGMVAAKLESDAASDAADKQTAAAHQANILQHGMFQQQRQDQEPWRRAGAGALAGLTTNPDFQRDFTAADFQKDPGYEFRMAEGQKAIERSAAARGGLQSGGTLKALSRYGQDYASSEYQNAYNRFNSDRDRRFNRLSSIAGLGQTANAQIGAAGQNYANQASQNMIGAANAQGAAGIASANAWGNGISNAAGAGMDTYWMNRTLKARGA